MILAACGAGDPETLEGLGAPEDPEAADAPQAEDPEDPDAPNDCPLGFAEDRDHGCVFTVREVGLAIRHFTEEGFVRINDVQFVQQHGPPKHRNIWVSKNMSAPSAYRSIDPTALTASIDYTFPVGTMLVHHAPAEPPFGVMLKREPGFAPWDNDWWFGRFAPDGTHQPSSGYGQTCQDCHTMDDRAYRTDMLWGVPRAAL